MDNPFDNLNSKLDKILTRLDSIEGHTVTIQNNQEEEYLTGSDIDNLHNLSSKTRRKYLNKAEELGLLFPVRYGARIVRYKRAEIDSLNWKFLKEMCKKGRIVS